MATRETLRLFLAVFPPPGVQRAAAAAIDALRSTAGGRGVSWVRRENLHFTLRFLGELGADGARRAGEAARGAAAAQAAFDATLADLGAFPDAARARVLWLGMREGGEALVALARSLDAALRSQGFGRADKPFAPHLTLGRVRERDADWRQALAAAPPAPAAFRVEALALVKSTLSPGGSRYETLVSAPLAAAPPAHRAPPAPPA